MLQLFANEPTQLSALYPLFGLFNSNITMVKYGKTLLAAALVVGSTSAFVAPSNVVRQTKMYMSDEAPTPPAAPPAPEKTTAIVAINEETVEFTAGLLGGAAGFIIGGPVLGAVGAAAAVGPRLDRGDRCQRGRRARGRGRATANAPVVVVAS